MHGTCSPTDRRILYKLGLWARNGWPVTRRMLDRALAALRQTLSNPAALKDWAAELTAANPEALVDGIGHLRIDRLEDSEQDEGSGTTVLTVHAVCARCGQGWPLAASEYCPQCRVIASQVWWFEANGRVSEARYIRRHNWFQD